MEQPIRFSTRYRSTIYEVMIERKWIDAERSQEFDFAWLTKEEISATYQQLGSSSRRFLINHFQSH